jgi:hypothetical protein
MYYVVVSDKGDTTGWLSSDYFKPISEVREDKLKEANSHITYIFNMYNKEDNFL